MQFKTVITVVKKKTVINLIASCLRNGYNGYYERTVIKTLIKTEISNMEASIFVHKTVP